MQTDDDNAREIEIALHEDDEPEEVDPMSPEERRIINEEAKAEEEFIADQEDSVNPMFFDKTEEEKVEQDQPSDAVPNQDLDGAFGSGGLVEEEPEDPVSNEEELRKEGADITYEPVDVAPAAEPLEHETYQEPVEPIANPDSIPAPEAIAPPVTDVATPTGDVVAAPSRSDMPTQIPAGMPTSSMSEIAQAAIRDATKPKKKFGMIAALAAVVLLIGVGIIGFLVYNQHEAPERQVSEAIDNLLDAPILGTAAKVVNIAAGNHPSLQITINDSELGAGENINASVAFKDSASIYFKLNNLNLIKNKLEKETKSVKEEDEDSSIAGNGLMKNEIYDGMFDAIENKWVNLSATDFSSDKEDEAKYKCVIESISTLVSGEYRKKIAGLYRNNDFLKYKEGSATETRDGITYYLIDINNEANKLFKDAIKETEEYQKFQSCLEVDNPDEEEETVFEDVAEEKDDTDYDKLYNTTTTYDVKLGISGWAHEIQAIEVVSKTTTKAAGDEKMTTLTVNIKFGYTPDGEIENAKKTKDVVDEIKKNINTAKDSYIKKSARESCNKIKDILDASGYATLDQCIEETEKAMDEYNNIDEIDLITVITGDLT